MHVFFYGGQIESGIHFGYLFYLLTKTWKYGGSVFGTEVAGGGGLKYSHV